LEIHIPSATPQQPTKFGLTMPLMTKRFSCLYRLLVAIASVFGLALGSHLPSFAVDSNASRPPDFVTIEKTGDMVTFMQTHCYDCHQGDSAEAGLDLQMLIDPTLHSTTPGNRDLLQTWVRLFDRVASGEMPPVDSEKPTSVDTKRFLAATGASIRAYQDREAAEVGRVRGRRLTNLQLERTLQDLFGIDIPLAKNFSDEPRNGGFTMVADGQAMSHFQLEQHLAAVDFALNEAFRRISGKPDEKIWKLSPKQLSRKQEQSRTREPEMRNGLAVVWSSGLEFYGRIPATTAPVSGWYRFRIKASSLKQPDDHGVWCFIQSGRCVSSSPLLRNVGIFEAEQDSNEWTFEAWLEAGEMLQVRPRDSALRLAKFAGGQVGTGEGEPQDVPGVAFHEIKMQRIHRGPADEEIGKILFGELQVNRRDKNDETSAGNASAGPLSLDVKSDDPKADITKLMVAFATRAFRRPVEHAEISSYIDRVIVTLDGGLSLAEAIQGGYRSLLISPRFLYFQEMPGPLDDYAIASRLSYMLWQSMPDKELMSLAAQGKLRDREVLQKQSLRMLATDRGNDFVKHFSDQWLDLRDIDFTEPDRKLYRDFDPIVQQSMLDETNQFLQLMLDDNRSVTELIDSDHTFLNSRLARYYGIEGVKGDAVRKVRLEREDHRGGVITHGAILKVTANGTTTSPVLRGVWIAERLLGDHIPPPPQNIPAIEPDIRGATSIRDMLEKHRSDDSCATCHVKIDPPGFALENYDPAGQWRDHYGSTRKKPSAEKSGPQNPAVERIDASYDLADGRHFNGIDDFRKLVISQPEKIANCVAEKLVTYGTGAVPRFADRDEINEISSRSSASNYGFRSILENVVTSQMFLNK